MKRKEGTKIKLANEQNYSRSKEESGEGGI